MEAADRSRGRGASPAVWHQHMPSSLPVTGSLISPCLGDPNSQASPSARGTWTTAIQPDCG